MPVVTDENILKQLNERNNGRTEQSVLPTGHNVVTDDALINKLNNRQTALKDDSWSALGSDVLVGISQGSSYNWIDELLENLGDEGVSKERYELALARNPYSTLGGEFAGGLATDVGVAAGVGATVGSVVPGAGTLAGGATGALAGVAKGLYRGGRLLQKVNALNKTRSLAGRTATFSGIGAAHGALAGAGSADQFGQTRAEGALEGAKYGALFGGAIPLGGSAIRGAGKAFGSGIKIALNSKAAKAAISNNIADDILTLIKNPAASGTSAGANFSDLVENVDKLAEASVKQSYKELNDAGIKVNIGGLRGEFAKVAKRYERLGRPEVASAITRSLGTSDSVSFSDAQLLRQNLRQLQRQGGLDYDDYGVLYTRLSNQIGKGAGEKGVKEYWEDTQKLYHEVKDLTKAKLFKKGVSDEGIREGDITSILNGQNPITGLKNQQRLLDNLAKYDKEGVLAVQDELKSAYVSQLLQNDGRLLLKILQRPDADEALKLATRNDGELVNQLKDLGKFASGRGDQSPSGVGRVLSNQASRLLAGGALTGFNPVAMLGQIALEYGGPTLAKRVMKNPKIKSIIRNAGKAKTESEAARLKTLMLTELASLGIVLTGFGVASQ